jgi:di/tricarboxylate transporter
MSGFSRPAVITILAVFILAEGLRRSGLTEQVGALLVKAGGASETRLVVVVMLAGAFLSLFMNNIAAASVLLPAVSSAASKSGVSKSRLLMPLAFATILGGMATLLTTTNIVVSGILRDENLRGFGPLDFLPVGVPVVIVGISFMALWGRRLLPEENYLERSIHQSRSDLVTNYNLNERLFRARVPEGSRLAKRPLAQSTLREDYGVSVVAVESKGKTKLSPSPDTTIDVGDVLVLEGVVDDFRARDIEPYLEILPSPDWHDQDLRSSTMIVVEAMIPPRSPLVGASLRDVHFREKYGMNVLVIGRAGEHMTTGFADLPLQFGDALLLQGSRERLRILRDEPDLILLAYEDQEPVVSGKAKVAIAIMAVSLLLAALNPASVSEIILAGAVAMMLFGVLSIDEAYRAIEWKSIFLIGGMLPLGLAMTESGAASMLAGQCLRLSSVGGPILLLIGLSLLCMFMTQAMTGAVVSTVIAPIAINAAHQAGIDPRALAMGIALASQMAFLTPIAHPVNVLVMGQAGYKPGDYLRAGLVLTVLMFVLVVLLVRVFWIRQ